MVDRHLRASVVVCTQNRSSFLEGVCNAILDVDFPRQEWELIIVDNASTDDSLEVAHGIRSSCPELVRVVEERTVGLSVARNRGIAEARGEIIVFIDDDAFPVRQWLQSLVEALGEDGVLCAGGPVEPMFQGTSEFPQWFVGRFLPCLTVWLPGSQPADLHYQEYPRGTNIAYRREAFHRFGGFSPHLGRRRKRLLSGEETEHCLRLERAGCRIVYVPEARVRHLTVVERITLPWIRRRFFWQGRSEVRTNWIHGGWLGIWVGLRGLWRNANTERRRRVAGDTAFASCQNRILLGYLAGIPSAVCTARYRPTVEACEPWLPFDLS